MFSFFQRVVGLISEVPQPIAAKLCHMIGNWFNFIIQVQNFGGAPPPKKWGAKNMQNFGRFYTTSDFDREYLWKGSRYPKSEKKWTDNNSSCFLQKRSGELWSTNLRDLDVKIYVGSRQIWRTWILNGLHVATKCIAAALFYQPCWISCVFSARQHAERALCYRPSVRPSVCLSFRPSHRWISRKRLKLGSCNFHHTVTYPAKTRGMGL